MEKSSIEPLTIESASSRVDAAEPVSHVDRTLEKKLLWKLDFRIIPALWFLFLVSFFDRSNIGYVGSDPVRFLRETGPFSYKANYQECKDRGNAKVPPYEGERLQCRRHRLHRVLYRVWGACQFDRQEAGS